MRPHFFILVACLFFPTTTCLSQEALVIGTIVDETGTSVPKAAISHTWRANGSPRKLDGSEYDLNDASDAAMFWGNLGDMQPWGAPPYPHYSGGDGEFSLVLPDRIYHLLVLDEDRRRGAVYELPTTNKENEPDIALTDLTKVSGRIVREDRSLRYDWAHLYVELPPSSSRPLASRRIVSCALVDGEFEFRLPPGEYLLDAYAISDQVKNLIDLRVDPPPKITVGKRGELDLGTFVFTDASPSREALERESKKSGRWSDYTEHYGELAPSWHAVDSRGIDRNTNIKALRGKWILLDFWGLSCAPCIATGVPKMMKFYEKHAVHRERFEIVGICIDHTGQIENMTALERELEPIVKAVWKGRTIEFPVVLDNTFRSWEAFGIKGLGTVVLVAPDGTLVKGDETTLEKILENGG
jgi:thiol-disulfide isomerase/thioredoxin